jgi:hypothetical protein
VRGGQQVFVISWRNPDARHADWSMDTYVQAILDALDAVERISGTGQTALVGVCAGGILASITASHLAGTGQQRRLAAFGLLVTVLDTARAGLAAALVDRRLARAAIAMSRRRGYLDGRSLAEVFAWLRPGDLVWNYWVNNYLLGRKPPAFDVLFWNADTTRMPARLHADFVDLGLENHLVTPEKGTPGYDARRIDGKGSLRAVWQAEIALTDLRVPEANRLPGANSFKDAGRVLAGTRNSVAWGALGHATAAYEVAAAYCAQRKQFGKPLVSFQIVQDRLVKMLAEVCSMQLYCLRLGRLIEEGKLTDTIAAIAKMNNTRKARQVILDARDLLGGNGILLDFHVIRHMADIEAIHTYEGTETIQTLIVGRDITGVGAFA